MLIRNLEKTDKNNLFTTTARNKKRKKIDLCFAFKN